MARMGSPTPPSVLLVVRRWRWTILASACLRVASVGSLKTVATSLLVLLAKMLLVSVFMALVKLRLAHV